MEISFILWSLILSDTVNKAQDLAKTVQWKKKKTQVIRGEDIHWGHPNNEENRSL